MRWPFGSYSGLRGGGEEADAGDFYGGLRTRQFRPASPRLGIHIAEAQGGT